MIAADCPEPEAITIDLSLVRDKTGRRVVASSPDGQVVGGLDIPILDPLPAPPPANEIGADYYNKDTYTVRYVRTFSVLGFPVGAGPAVLKTHGDIAVGLTLKAAW